MSVLMKQLSVVISYIRENISHLGGELSKISCRLLSSKSFFCGIVDVCYFREVVFCMSSILISCAREQIMHQEFWNDSVAMSAFTCNASGYLPIAPTLVSIDGWLLLWICQWFGRWKVYMRWPLYAVCLGWISVVFGAGTVRITRSFSGREFVLW